MTPSPLRLVRDRITRAELALLAETGFGDMVKAVVDDSIRARIRAAVTDLVSE
jgi:hypothetical protein